MPIEVLAANCASPAGLANVSVTVNGNPVSLSAESPDSGLYTGTYTPSAPGSLTISATASVGASTDTRGVTGSAAANYTCQAATYSWIDATSGTNIALSGDDVSKSVALAFPFTFYAQSFSSVTVSSNGFLELGSTAGSTEFMNEGIPGSDAPNGIIAPFWDDLNLATSGSIRTLVRGTSPNRNLTIEWLNVPRFQHEDGTPLTFEATLYEGTNEIRFRYLHTTIGGAAEANEATSSGLSATAGLESVDGTAGKQYSYNQPLLTDGKTVSCTGAGFTPPPPPPPNDTQPPTAPASLKLSIVGTRQAILYWQASTDDVGVTRYDVYRDGVKVGEATSRSFLDGGLTPGVTYRYTVKAADAAGNVSAASGSVSARAVALSTSQTGTAAGTVVDAVSGAPVANVVVSTTVGTSVRRTKTNGSGVFKLTSLPPGSYALTLTLGSRTVQANAGVAAGETTLTRQPF